MPAIVRNKAAVPTPSELPDDVPVALPPPASVVTARVAKVTLRMRLLPLSPTKTVWAVAATLTGRLNSAALPESFA